jgi:hypothetical protein
MTVTKATLSKTDLLSTLSIDFRYAYCSFAECQLYCVSLCKVLQFLLLCQVSLGPSVGAHTVLLSVAMLSRVMLLCWMLCSLY